MKEIKVEDGNAVGVILENGEEVAADYVISAMDLHTALEKLLGGRLGGSPYEKYFQNQKPFPSCVQVSPGVDMDFSSEPDYLTLSFPVQEPINVGDREFHSIYFKHYASDPTLAPGGLPTGVKTSRDILQLICKKEDRDFTSSQTVL